MADPMTHPDDLRARLGHPDAPVLIDVRTTADAARDPTCLPGATRLTLAALEAGAGPRSGAAVVYCQKGGKISRIAAALLRGRDVEATALAGGHLAWLDQDRPRRDLDIPARWLASDDPDWASAASEWVLRRLVDGAARVLRIAPDEVPAGCAAWDAAALPDAPSDLARIVGLMGFDLTALDVTPDRSRLMAGRLRRGGDPLDLIDDAFASARA